MSVNKAILVGNLGSDPELKYTPSGNAVANFSLATTEKWTGKDGQKNEKTTWHNIVAWGKTAELAKEYLSKGRQVYTGHRFEKPCGLPLFFNRATTTERVDAALNSAEIDTYRIDRVDLERGTGITLRCVY